MIILDAIFPVFALLACGLGLKKIRLTNDTFLATCDRLIYYLFFPVMLFFKIGSASPEASHLSLGFCLAVILSVSLAWGASLMAIRVMSVPRFKAGTFSQAAFRFNSYIGLAVIINTVGESGIRSFGILIGIIIPVINLLSILTLIAFGKKQANMLQAITQGIKALVTNPLIIGCAAGMLYSRTGLGFPIFIENTFQLMILATMPLTLISIGGALKLDRHSLYDTRLSIAAAGIKLLLLPLTGFLLLKSFGVGEDLLKIGMIYFALPTSPSIFVLSAQMGSDTQLASNSVLISTIFSFFSLSLAVLI